MQTPCPGILVLESLALGGECAADDARAHVAGCSACRAAVEEIRENQRFLAQEQTNFERALAWADDAERAGPLAGEHGPDGYSLIEEVGRGGQGVVWLAVQRSTKRRAAVKMLLAGGFATARQRVRFEREIETASSLRHQNIVSVFESGVTPDGRPYIAMEYVEGAPLEDYAAGALAPVGDGARVGQVMSLMAKIASAVGHAHSNGVIHRDLKPSNILVEPCGNPRVLDFGLARTLPRGDEAAMTREFAGTPAFASPEQFAGETVDARSDVYALGLIMYRLLAGAPPYPCDGGMAQASRHAAQTTPAPLSARCGRIAADVETIVLKALSKEPDRRYASAGAMAADIEDALAGRPISARRDSTLYVLGVLARRHRAAVVAGALAVFTAAGAIVGLTLLAGTLDQQRRAAQEALTVSTIQRARLMVESGDVTGAERLLWQEAVRARVNAADSGLCLEADPDKRRVSWALVELYSRAPRLMSVRLGRVVVAVGLDEADDRVWAVGEDGRWAAWTLDGREVARSPGWLTPPRARVTNASADGRFVLATTETDDAVYELATRELIWKRNRGEGSQRRSMIDHAGRSVAVLDQSEGLLSVIDIGSQRAGTVPAVAPHALGGFGRSGRGDWIGFSHEESKTHAAAVVFRAGDSFELVRRVASGVVNAADANFVGVSASGNGRVIAAGLAGAVCVWDSDADTEPRVLRGHRSSVLKTHLNQDGGMCLSISQEGELILWDVAQATKMSRWNIGARPQAMYVTADGARVVAGDARGLVHVFDSDASPWVRRPDHGEGGLHGLALSPCGTKYACAGERGSVRVFDAVTNEAILRFEAHEGMVTGLCYDGAGETIVSTGLDGAVRAWDAATGLAKGEIEAGLPQQWALASSVKGGALAVGGLGDSVGLYHARDGGGGYSERMALRLPGGSARTPSLAFDSSGKYLAAAIVNNHMRTGTVVVWETGNGRVIQTLEMPAGVMRSVAFSPDGALLAAGGDDRAVTLWEVSDRPEWKKRVVIEGLGRDVFGLCFDPTGRLIFAATRSPDIQVFDTHRGVGLATFITHEGLVFRIAMTPDGKRLYTAGEDPWISVWDMDRLRADVRGNARRWAAELEKGVSVGR